MRKILFTNLILLCVSLIAFSQRTITGTILDDAGESLIGTNILAKGTAVGTISDFDGKYSLTVPDGVTALVFSYTGYNTQEIEIGTSDVIDVVMFLDAIGLEDIIVIGYSPTRRKDITGSVSSVSSEDLTDVPNLGVQDALRGRTTGVTVTQASGTPGASIDVRVRGSSSINASNQPLYIIDGVPLIAGDFAQVAIGGQDLNALADLNPSDIESIEVLKDASTAAIYGSRGANGVVLITTKKGKAGATKIEFNATYGFQDRANKVELMSADQYREQMELVFGSPDALAGGLGGNTDWYDEIFEPSNLQNYNVNISGGDVKTRFFASLTYDDNQGIIKKSRFERYNARLNLDHIASEKLTFGMNLGYNYSRNQRVRNDNNIFGALSVATLWPATVPVFNEDGSYASSFGWDNPVASITIYENLVTQNRVTGNMFGSFKITDDLTFKSSLGIDALQLREDVYEPSELQSSNSGTARIGQTQDIRWLMEHTLTYQKRFDQHSLTAIVGAGYQVDEIDQDFSRVDDFPTDDFRGLSAGATPTSITGQFLGDVLHSYFGNVNYAFGDKYIITGTLRADGSSRFVNDKWGFFPGISAAWRLSSEDFIGTGVFDDLKLRIGWGQTGNNSIGRFQARRLVGGGNNYLDNPGITITQLGNPDLTWETTTSINVGVDFAVLDQRFGGSIDLYQKNTENLLLNRPIPTTSGFTTVPTNVGEVENKGIELGLYGSPVRSAGGFNWNIDVNISYNKNEILSLFNNQPIDLGFATRLAEGHPIGAFFGWITDGIFQNQAEVEAHATQNRAAPGDIRYMDISGGAGDDGILGTADDLPPDGVINDADRTFIGQGLPDWVGGITNSFSYKDLELSGFFQFSLGNDIYNNNGEFSEGMHSVFNSTKRAWEGRWQQEGDDEDFPRAVGGDPNNNRRNSTRFVENGSYLRLKTLTLSYSLPSSIIEKLNVRSLRLAVTGKNVFTITDYSWFDPEVSTFGEANTTPGTDFLTFPQAKSVAFSLNLGF